MLAAVTFSKSYLMSWFPAVLLNKVMQVKHIIFQPLIVALSLTPTMLYIHMVLWLRSWISWHCVSANDCWRRIACCTFDLKIISPHVLKCHQCGILMNNSNWNNCLTSTKQPWMIHGVNDVMSAVYTCDNRHKILAHDESILKLLPQTLIPFMLSHKTGSTKDLYCNIRYLASIEYS